MENLWSANTPSKFWMIQPDPSQEAWHTAVSNALLVLGLGLQLSDIDQILALTLGEGQFGADHWRLSISKRFYYEIKPFLPRPAVEIIKKLNSRPAMSAFQLGWPVEPGYVRFQWEILRQLLLCLGQPSLAFRWFWPDGLGYSLVLTHDIETEQGQAFAGKVAELEESLGFVSSFNFVPERYPLDDGLIGDLRKRGFEIGVHGLKHDGKLFNSKKTFLNRARRINDYLKDFDAIGFRAPYMQRNPEWMQALEIDYDLSFFDTDPYEPVPGGSMTIWPFFIGKFLELPYTLAQDSTLLMALGERTPRPWLEKVEFIRQNHGMALLNCHPDYLKEPKIWKIYVEFLNSMKEKRGGYWQALPRDVARWWRNRAEFPEDQISLQVTYRNGILENDQAVICE